MIIKISKISTYDGYIDYFFPDIQPDYISNNSASKPTIEDTKIIDLDEAQVKKIAEESGTISMFAMTLYNYNNIDLNRKTMVAFSSLKDLN